MQGSVRALKAVPSYTTPIEHERKGNNTQKYTYHNAHENNLGKIKHTNTHLKLT